MSEAPTTPSLSGPQPLAADESLPWVDAGLLRRMIHDLRAPIRHVRFFESSIRESLPAAMNEPTEQESILESLDVVARAGALMDQSLDALRELIEATSGDLDGTRVPLEVPIQSAWETVSEEHSDVTAHLKCNGDTSLIVLRDPWTSIFRHFFRNMFLNGPSTTDLQVCVSINPHWTDADADSTEARMEQVLLEDNGIGIREQDWQKALLPMQRIRVRQPPRPGLGLTIASHLAKRCGYQVEWVKPNTPINATEPGTSIMLRLTSDPSS